MRFLLRDWLSWGFEGSAARWGGVVFYRAGWRRSCVWCGADAWCRNAHSGGAALIPLSITAVLTIAGIAIIRFEGEFVRPLVAAALTSVLGLPLGLIVGAFAGGPFAWAVIGSAISGALGAFIGRRVFDPDSSESWATSVIGAFAIATVWIVWFEIMGGLTQHWAPYSAAGFLNGWAGALVHLLG